MQLLFSAAGDYLVNYHVMLPDLLHDGIEVLVYAGEMDYLCNWCGNKAWTTGLEWNGKEAFNQAADDDYKFNGRTAGRMRSAQGLHFMQVYDAGHLVPMDKPEVALDMLNKFIHGASPGPSPSPMPTPVSGHYGQPPCNSDETEMQFGGGSVCASKCTDTSDCPSDVPAGTKATPQCSLLQNSHCGLRCGRDAGCPDGATCYKIGSLTGNCVYSSTLV